MKKTTLPVGMHDKLFKRANVTYRIERSISDLLISRGFNRIETPTLEHVEVFGDEINNRHYHLFDKTGNLLALRPDITSQIGRVIASTRVETPIKFSYSGKVFHYNEEMRGLANELTQAGIEIVGYPAQEALQSALKAAQEALVASGVQDYQFEFSHASIMAVIFETLNLDEEQANQLAGLIRDKSITGLRMFTQANPSDLDDFLTHLPLLFGETETVLTEARELTQHPQILEGLDAIAELTRSVSDSLPQTTVDLAQLPTMPYYTGIMFKVFGDKIPDAFVSGGRYDKLFERFGAKELTAVGWAIDIDSVYQAIQDSIVFEGGNAWQSD
ncbi:ATP phosphoribosyltransferase regulatory subunit [Streptococcus caprae]|uniref:ATP phosphoribosyltransferase regulatory subunit n=1 Tax=Streptococcus caprae TaxID=1640501 RepID=A0ABV8CW72_9STRE